MSTVCVMRLTGAKLTVVDQRPCMPGFSAILKVKGINITSTGVNPLSAMWKLMSDDRTLRWKRQLEHKMPRILAAA